MFSVGFTKVERWIDKDHPCFPESLERLAEGASLCFAKPAKNYPIFNLRKALSEIQQNEEELLSQITNDLATFMPPNKKLIKKYYDGVKYFPRELKDRLNEAINMAFLQKFVKNPRVYIENATEKLVLDHLGYSLDEYNERVKLRDEVRKLSIKKLFSDKLSTSPKRFQGKFRYAVRIIRLNLAGVDKIHSEYIRAIVHQVYRYRDLFDHAAANYPLKGLKGSSPIAKKISTSFKKGKIRALRTAEVENFLKINRKKIHELMKDKDLSSFKEEISNLCLSSFNDPRLKIFRHETMEVLEETLPEIDWFNKYQHLITIEFCQGFLDPREVSDGMCYALTLRFVINALENPNREDKDYEADEVFPKDRFRQNAHHVLKGLITDQNPPPQIPKKILKHYDEAYLPYVSNTDVESLNYLNGAYLLLIKRHALGLQIDKTNRKFSFYDANLGIVRLNINESISEEAASKNLLDILQEYILAFEKKTRLVCPIEYKKRSN